jgi:hypothetical protein
MKVAWPLMSLPLMFRTCRFLIIAIASTPASVRRAVRKLPNPSPGRTRRLMRLWSCSTILFSPASLPSHCLSASIQKQLAPVLSDDDRRHAARPLSTMFSSARRGVTRRASHCRRGSFDRRHESGRLVHWLGQNRSRRDRREPAGCPEACRDAGSRQLSRSRRRLSQTYPEFWSEGGVRANSRAVPAVLA